MSRVLFSPLQMLAVSGESSWGWTTSCLPFFLSSPKRVQLGWTVTYRESQCKSTICWHLLLWLLLYVVLISVLTVSDDEVVMGFVLGTALGKRHVVITVLLLLPSFSPCPRHLLLSKYLNIEDKWLYRPPWLPESFILHPTGIPTYRGEKMRQVLQTRMHTLADNDQASSHARRLKSSIISFCANRANEQLVVSHGQFSCLKLQSWSLVNWQHNSSRIKYYFKALEGYINYYSPDSDLSSQWWCLLCPLRSYILAIAQGKEEVLEEVATCLCCSTVAIQCQQVTDNWHWVLDHTDVRL